MASTSAKARFLRAHNNNYIDFLKTPGITVTKAPTEFRAPGLGNEFLEAATDPYSKSRSKRFYKPENLWKEVIGKSGAVDSETARQFVNDLLSGVFANSARIHDPRARQGLNALGFETIMSLYESISQSDAKGNSLYLRALYTSLEIPDSFYEKRITPVAQFFDENRKAEMEQKWTEARREGRIPDHDGSFEDAMGEELASPPIWSAADAKRRVQLLQFLCDSYSDSIGETRVRVGLFNGKPGLKGFYMHKTDENEEVIGLNISEMGNFQACVGILMHERHHASQQRLADAYRAGQIGKDHADYMAARIFAANGEKGGYINGDRSAGMRGYRFQPLELDAHNAGSVAEYMVFKTYARKPGIYTERHIRPDPSAPAQKLHS